MLKMRHDFSHHGAYRYLRVSLHYLRLQFVYLLLGYNVVDFISVFFEDVDLDSLLLHEIFSLGLQEVFHRGFAGFDLLGEETVQSDVVVDGFGCLGSVGDVGHEGADGGEAGLVLCAHGGLELGLEGGEDGGLLFGGEGCGRLFGEEGPRGEKCAADEHLAGRLKGEGRTGEAEERHI